MSNPPPLEYQSFGYRERSKDDSHLRTLSILHYVWGALVCLFSSFFIGYIVLGVLTIRGQGPFFGTPGSGGPPPQIMGWMFLVMGCVTVGLGWSTGILNFVSAYSLGRRRRRMLSLVTAGVNCLSVPLGTTLGVFTFIVLFRESVVREYRAV